MKRVGTGSAQTLKTGSYNFGEVRIRVKHRAGGLEFEWQNEMEHWQNLHTVNLSGNPETLRVDFTFPPVTLESLWAYLLTTLC